MATISIAKSIEEYSNALWQIELNCCQCKKNLAIITLPATLTSHTGDLAIRTKQERDRLGIKDFCSDQCEALFKQQEYENAVVNEDLTRMLEGML